MTIDQQANYQKIIEDDFIVMKNMLEDIRFKITEYPVYTQMAFITPLKNIILEAWSDSCDKENYFLNNAKFGDDSINI